MPVNFPGLGMRYADKADRLRDKADRLTQERERLAARLEDLDVEIRDLIREADAFEEASLRAMPDC